MPRVYIDFWYEFASTYSYPAAMRIEEIAEKAEVELRWRPFLLGPIFKDQGLANSPFIVYPVKGEYMWRDIWRVCRQYNVEYKRPEIFPQNGLLGARVATALEGRARMLFTRVLYVSQFAHGRDISQKETVIDAIKGAGLDPESVLADADSPATRTALRAATDEARKRGVFGAPAFVVSDGELFWGHDRMEDAFEWARNLKRQG